MTRTAAKKRHGRDVTYEEQCATRTIQRGKYTKADLEADILGRAKVIGKQARELQELREKLAEANERAAKYAEIDRALHTIARARVLRDREKAKPADDAFFQRPPNQRTQERTRCTTQPQALAEELLRIEATVDELNLDGEERRGFEEQIEELNRERGLFLDALGIDEHEWCRRSWWK